MIKLTHDAIDTNELMERAAVPTAGAVVMFVGITREFTEQRQTQYLEYDAYPEMAERELRELERAARERWPLAECALVHRLGRVEISEASVAVAVSSAHRNAAFEAGKWLIDELKVRVPIWKKEHGVDGSSSWVHPHGEAMEAAPRE